MQHQVASKLFQRMTPLGLNVAQPNSRICDNPVSMILESRAKSIIEHRSKMSEIEEMIAPNPLMHRPGETNPLGEFSPYLPPLHIPGEKYRRRCGQ